MKDRETQTKLLRMPEVAKRLDISLRTAWTRAAAGDFPVLRLSSNCSRVREADLEAYVERLARQAEVS